MNDLQKKEFELLKCFIGICEILDLQYYLVCGSALGAVKYQGFIPWDDDIDVALPRVDYMLFMSEAHRYLPKNIFLQNYMTDPNFPFYFSKLRNSETTFIEKSSAHLPINHGVYIDIFPLDGYPTTKMERILFEVRKKIYSMQLSCVFELDRNYKSKVACFVNRLLGYHKRTMYTTKKIEKLFCKYEVYNSLIWCNHGNWQGKLEYAPKEQYGEGIWMKFEGIDVRVPEQYDEYLKQKYGNYMTELPKEQQVGHHYYEILDLEKSYKEYI